MFPLTLVFTLRLAKNGHSQMSNSQYHPLESTLNFSISYNFCLEVEVQGSKLCSVFLIELTGVKVPKFLYGAHTKKCMSTDTLRLDEIFLA